MPTLVKYMILALSTFACIYSSIDIAFDVVATPGLGGCDANQRRNLTAAFDEAVEMAHLIWAAVNEMAENQESPRVGYLVHAMFAVTPTERLADSDSEDESEGLNEEGEIQRTNAEMEVLLSIEGMYQVGKRGGVLTVLQTSCKPLFLMVRVIGHW